MSNDYANPDTNPKLSGEDHRRAKSQGEISGEITGEEITGGDNRVEITEGNHRGNHLLLFKL